MRRLRVLLVTYLMSEADHAKHMLEGMGHIVVEVLDATGAIEMIDDHVSIKGVFDAVIIDGFSLDAAEMIALEIKSKYLEMYVGIMSEAVKHREHNTYADDTIPEIFAVLRDTLECRFPEAI